jgi:hypothetical protein
MNLDHTRVKFELWCKKADKYYGKEIPLYLTDDQYEAFANEKLTPKQYVEQLKKGRGK